MASLSSSHSRVHSGGRARNYAALRSGNGSCATDLHPGNAEPLQHWSYPRPEPAGSTFAYANPGRSLISFQFWGALGIRLIESNCVRGLDSRVPCRAGRSGNTVINERLGARTACESPLTAPAIITWVPSLQQPAALPGQRRLIIVSGEEGAGKSTIVRALLPFTPSGARLDAEDIGQTNPCPMDDQFFGLLHRNVAGLVENFWGAGYVNVIAGSFLRCYRDYVTFRQLLSHPAQVFLVDLRVERKERDRRRTTRAKQTTQEWHDMVDQIPEDQTIRDAADADYTYIGIDTTRLDVATTADRVRSAIPQVYAGQ